MRKRAEAAGGCSAGARAPRVADGYALRIAVITPVATRRARARRGAARAPHPQSRGWRARAARGAEQRPRGLLSPARHEDVARPRGEEVRHVEPAGAAHERRDAGLQQQALDQLGLRLVLGASRRAPAPPRRTADGSCGRARAPRPPAAGAARPCRARTRRASRSAGRSARSVRRRCRTRGTRAARSRSALLDLELGSRHRAVPDVPCADVVARGILDADDHVDDLGEERAREVDVGLGRLGIRARVRVVDDRRRRGRPRRSRRRSAAGPCRRCRRRAGWPSRCGP